MLNPRRYVRLTALAIAVLLIASACIGVANFEEGAVLTAPATIHGVAQEEDGAVTEVRLWIKDTVTDQYWNDSNSSWQGDWVEFDALLANPGAEITGWSYAWDPSGTGGSGSYRLRGVSYDNGVKSEVYTRFFSVLETPGTELFFDDFDGAAIDPARWKVVSGDYGADDSPGTDDGYRDQCYTSRATNARVEDGSLVLEAHRETPPASITQCADDTINFTSGMVVSNDDGLPASSGTRGNLAWHGGRFEMRARMDDVSGMWPAFWLRPANPPLPWPGSGEIDILEYPGPTPNGSTTPLAVHSGAFHGVAGAPVNDNGELVVGPGAVEAWHNYRVDWDETTMRFYFDNTLVHEAAIVVPPYDPEASFFITLNLQVDGWAGEPDPATDTATFEIDWIRVSEL